MDEYITKLLIEALKESIDANAKIDALVSMNLDIIQKEEFIVLATKFRKERVVELLLQFGDLFSDDDEEFLRSKFD